MFVQLIKHRFLESIIFFPCFIFLTFLLATNRLYVAESLFWVSFSIRCDIWNYVHFWHIYIVICASTIHWKGSVCYIELPLYFSKKVIWSLCVYSGLFISLDIHVCLCYFFKLLNFKAVCYIAVYSWQSHCQELWKMWDLTFLVSQEVSLTQFHGC